MHCTQLFRVCYRVRLRISINNKQPITRQSKLTRIRLQQHTILTRSQLKMDLLLMQQIYQVKQQQLHQAMAHHYISQILPAQTSLTHSLIHTLTLSINLQV